jgi:hypothetical protein
MPEKELKTHLFTPSEEEAQIYLSAQKHSVLDLHSMLAMTPQKACEVITKKLPKLFSNIEKGSYPEIVVRSALKEAKLDRDSLLLFAVISFLNGMVTAEGLALANDVLYDSHTKYPFITTFGSELKKDGAVDKVMEAAGFGLLKYIVSHPKCFVLLGTEDEVLKSMVYFIALCDIGTLLKNKKYAFSIKVSAMGPHAHDVANSLACFVKLYGMVTLALMSGIDTGLAKKFNAYLEGRNTIKSLYYIVNTMLGMQPAHGVEH